jgi:hypothetical protein
MTASRQPRLLPLSPDFVNYFTFRLFLIAKEREINVYPKARSRAVPLPNCEGDRQAMSPTKAQSFLSGATCWGSSPAGLGSLASLLPKYVFTEPHS